MNIFVGNLSFQAKEADVYQAFSAFGKVLTVTIIMEKKGDKSRGFGFVEMLDEVEALAAIAGLHEKELLGRPIHVMPALPKKPRKERPVVAHEPKKEFHPKPDFKRATAHRKGRRSLSFMKKSAEAGIPVAPKKEYKENPMRWRRKAQERKPWDKTRGEVKPWDKTKGESKPWIKSTGESKPWQKSAGESKPWKKSVGGSKTWEKSVGESKPWEKKPAGDSPWVKAKSWSKPWKKAKGEAKWKKASPGGKPWGKPKKVAAHWEKHLSKKKE